MIFLTVGSALPFDRLVRMVDQAVAGGRIDQAVFAQIGDGDYLPQHMEYTRFLPQSEFEQTMNTAQAVISHAGIGTITAALKREMPLLVLPRSPAYGELVDDHQEKTATAFAQQQHLLVFHDDHELEQGCRALQQFVPRTRTPNAEGIARAIGIFLAANAAHPAGQSTRQQTSK